MVKKNILADLINILLYLMGLFSTFYIFRIKSIQFSTIFALLSLIIICVYKIKIKIAGCNSLFFLFIISAIFTSIINLFLPLSNTYNINVSVVGISEFIILYFCILQISQLGEDSIYKFISGLRMSCYIHIIWCFLQIILYQFLDMDINQMFFGNLLNMGNGDYGVSRYEGGQLVISGFCWHPVNLAPTLLLSVLLLNKWYIWIAAFFIAFYSKNDTTMVILSAALVLYMFTILKKKISIHKIVKYIKRHYKIFIAIIIGSIILVQLFPLIKLSLTNILDRVQNVEDSSTEAHLNYYTAWPMIASKQSILELLFGCGIGRSGAYISKFFNQYVNIDYWSVESDPMNYLYSTGLIGFILMYSWLISIALKSYKKNVKYFIFFLTILLGGIAYGIQFPWVISLELFFGMCIKMNIDIFDNKFSPKNLSILYLKNKKRGIKNGIKY